MKGICAAGLFSSIPTDTTVGNPKRVVNGAFEELGLYYISASGNKRNSRSENSLKSKIFKMVVKAQNISVIQ